MEEKILEIPLSELIESLKLGYKEYKEALMQKNDLEDIGYLRGYCITLERILQAYGEMTTEEISTIKKAVLGDVEIKRQTALPQNDELDAPAYFRRLKSSKKNAS